MKILMDIFLDMVDTVDRFIDRVLMGFLKWITANDDEDYHNDTSSGSPSGIPRIRKFRGFVTFFFVLWVVIPIIFIIIAII